ncbi:hypothetical protein LCGC14_1770500 [marine sediment metagenome]|uniref:Uncharacterized protein n=1 Tax=marine sediment metagenome TaxID=412755 RepID=A0A0F9HKZ4_9ZZZZ
MTEATLKIELGDRALSWLYNVNPYEWEPEAFNSIPSMTADEWEWDGETFKKEAT